MDHISTNISALTLALSVSSMIGVAVEAAVPAKMEFNRDVRPMPPCRSLDKNHHKARLRLDLRDEVLAKEHG